MFLNTLVISMLHRKLKTQNSQKSCFLVVLKGKQNQFEVISVRRFESHILQFVSHVFVRKIIYDAIPKTANSKDLTKQTLLYFLLLIAIGMLDTNGDDNDVK